MQQADTVIALINSILFGGSAADSVNQMTGEQLSALFQFCKKQDLAPLAAAALETHAIPEEIKQTAVNAMMTAAVRYEQMYYEQQRLCRLLEENGIDYMLLKGAVIRQYYPEPWMRTSCDVDILVRQEQFERALELAQSSLGWKKSPHAYHDITLLTQSGVHIELHRMLMEDYFANTSSRVLDTVWQQARPDSEKPHSFSMSDELFLFYHVAHMAKHFETGGCGIRFFLDLWLLENRLHYQQAQLLQMLETADIRLFYEKSKQLAQVWFAAGSHDEITRNMKAFVLSGGIYGKLENEIALSRDRGQSKFRHFWNMFFLSRERLALIYPKLNTAPWLTPFYQVKRWFGVFNPKRRKNILHRLNTDQNLSEETITSVGQLMRTLHLKTGEETKSTGDGQK